MINHSLKLNGRIKLREIIKTGMIINAGKKIKAATPARKLLSNIAGVAESFFINENDLSNTRRIIRFTKCMGCTVRNSGTEEINNAYTNAGK